MHPHYAVIFSDVIQSALLVVFIVVAGTFYSQSKNKPKS